MSDNPAASYDFDRMLGAGDDDAALLDEFLGGDEGHQEAPAAVEAPKPPARREEPPRPSGGLQPKIAAVRKQIDELAQKITTQRETGVYVVRDEDGSNARFDYVALQEDQTRLSQLRMEWDDLKERDREYRDLREGSAKTAAKFAKEFLRRELPRYDERVRGPLAEKFAELFRAASAEGVWSSAQYSDKGRLVAALQSLMETSLGIVAKSQFRRADQAGKPNSGFEAGDDDADKAKDKPEDDDDEFTRGIMEAYNRRKAGSMSVADQRRAQIAAAQAKEGASR